MQTRHRLQEQPGANQQQQRERELADHQRLPEPDSARPWSRMPARRAAASPNLERGRERAHAAGDDADQQREEKDALIHAGGQIGARRRNDSSTRETSGAATRPSAPPASVSSRLSTRSCREMRPRDAPSAMRVVNSRVRAAPRASRRLATLDRPAKAAARAAHQHRAADASNAPRRSD